MDPAAATGQVRVAIVGDGAVADLALPTTMAIRELIPRIRTTLASGRDDDELTPEEDISDGLRPYSLAPLGGTPFSLDATLETLAIDDGEQLILCKLPPGPAAPPVVEDIADASAIHSAHQFKPFTHQLLPAMAQVVVLVLGALVCGLALDGWHRGYQWWAAGALGLLCRRLHGSDRAAAPPRPRRGRRPHGGGHHRPAGVGPHSGVARGRGGSPRLPGRGRPAGMVTAAVGDHQHLGRHLHRDHRRQRDRGDRRRGAHVSPTCPICRWAAACWPSRCSWRSMRRPRLRCGPRFPLPNVPAPGEPTPPPLALTEIEDLPRKTATSASYQSGLIAASVILAVLGSVLVVWLPDAPALLAWWLVIATITVTVLRMRIWDSAIPALWFLATPFLTALALTISFAATGHLLAGLYAAAAAAGLTVVLLIAAALKPRQLTIPQRRYLDLFENTLLITILPAMLWLVGLVSLIRNRGAI